MRLVDHQQVVIFEKVQQAICLFPRLSAVKVPGIILYPGAEPQLLYHLEIIFGPHLKPLPLQLAQLRQPIFQLVSYRLDRPGPDGVGYDVVACRKDGHGRNPPLFCKGDVVKERESFYLVAEHGHPYYVCRVCRHDIYGVAFYPKVSRCYLGVVALVSCIDEFLYQVVSAHLLVGSCPDCHAVPVKGVAEGVDARYGGYDDCRFPGAQHRSGLEAKPFDLFVNLGVLFNVGVSLW